MKAHSLRFSTVQSHQPERNTLVDNEREVARIEWLGSDQDAEDLAAFIVTACNTHNELVGLVRAYRISNPLDAYADKADALLAKMKGGAK